MVVSSNETSVTIYTTLQGVTSHKAVILVASFGTSTIIDGKIGLAGKNDEGKRKNIPKGSHTYIYPVIFMFKTAYRIWKRYCRHHITLFVLELVFMGALSILHINPYPTAFPYGNGMVLHFYQQQESSTTKTVHKVINKRLKTYV